QVGQGVASELASLGEVFLLVAVPGLVVEGGPQPAQPRQLGGVGQAAAALLFLAGPATSPRAPPEAADLSPKFLLTPALVFGALEQPHPLLLVLDAEGDVQLNPAHAQLLQLGHLLGRVAAEEAQ